MSVNMKKKRIIALLALVAMVLSSLPVSNNGTKAVEVKAAAYASVAEDLDVFDSYDAETITLNMGAGWNLGNQLEASNSGGVPSETAWNNGTISEETLKMVKNAGFSTVRIPVSYLKKIGDGPNYTIDVAWLNRIKEVVDYAVNNGLYVIINMHGDGYNSVTGGWLLCNASDDQQPQIKEKYKKCWEQIANTFKDYDEHLIFESMNEEFDGKTYGAPVNKTYYSNINAYNQIFVDAVRQSGGNNDKRWLLIPGWNTNIELTVGNYGFALPTDSHLSAEVPLGEKRIMVSVHFYDPYEFTHEAQKQGKTQWGKSAPDSSKKVNWDGYIPDEPHVNAQLKLVYDKFSSKGYPVVIGEYGAIDCSGADSQNLACRKAYYKTVCEYSLQYGCVPVAWDNGVLGTTGENNFGLFDRGNKQATLNGREIITSIMEAYNPDIIKAKVVEHAKNVQASFNDYTKDDDHQADSWTAFEAARTALNEVMADATSETEAILSAITQLKSAKGKLDKEKADKEEERKQQQAAAAAAAAKQAAVTKATATITEAEKLVQAEYTTESWKTFSDALTALKTIKDNASSTAEQVENAINTLETAKAALAKVAATSGGEQQTNPTQTTAPTGPKGETGTGTSTKEEEGEGEEEEEEEDDSEPDRVTLKKVNSPSKKKLKVTWVKLDDADGYQVKVGTNKNVTKQVKTKLVKKGSVTSYVFSNCRRKKTYYAKVRAYILEDGEKVYGDWSKTGKKAKVK